MNTYIYETHKLEIEIIVALEERNYELALSLESELKEIRQSVNFMEE